MKGNVMAKKPVHKAVKKVASVFAPKVPVKSPVVKPVVAKKPEKYNAAGLNVVGMTEVIRNAEYKRLGLKGYPWKAETKKAMMKACQGAKTMADVEAEINAIADYVTPRAA